MESHAPSQSDAKEGVLTTYLEATDLVNLSTNDEHGRIVVATKSIKTGIRFIRERPVLVWKEDNWTEYLTKFKALPATEQSGVLDMYYFPLDAQQLQPLKYDVARSAGIVGVDKQLAIKLLSISMANSHEYFGSTDAVYEEVASFIRQNLRSTGKRALFLYASKVSHSCHPNTTYTSKTDDGKMEYKSVREIKEGDMISFPYIGDLWETPTNLRRKALQESRSFFCKCKRCLRPDLLRFIKCKSCTGDCGVATCTYDSLGTPSWTCENCNTVLPSSYCEKTEAVISAMIEQTEMKMMMGGLQSLPLSEVTSVITKAEQMLSPLHFLLLRARGLYVKLCASKAHDMSKT